MKRCLFLVAALLAVGCYQSSDNKLPEQGTPPPNAAGGVTVPADVVPWTADKCMVDDDCAGAEGLGVCQEGVCQGGECIAVNLLPGAACPVEGLGTCQSGVCKAQDDGKLACVSGVAPNGTVCGEFFAACVGAGRCIDGVCVDPCDDGNPCTADKCTDNGCTATPQPVECNDNNPCTENDGCKDGLCVGEKVCDCTKDGDCFDLEDGNLCNGTLECKEGKCSVKKGTVVDCPKTGFEPCQANVCAAETGKCSVVVADDETPCDDAVECTDGTFCAAGACTGLGTYTCEVLCDDLVDEDQDGTQDCLDSDCYGVGECPLPACDDGDCQEYAGETCANCPEDCGECPPECGDGKLTPETGEECDDKNKDPGDGCDDACKVEPAPAAPGDVIVTEIMKNPELVDDAKGEWLELFNTTDKDIDINAWTLEDKGTDSHRIFAFEGVIIPAGSYAVLGVNEDALTNGGVTVAYQYKGLNLGNKDDELILSSGDTVVDEAAYTEGAPFPVGQGASLSLSPSKLTAADNDLGENWCDGQVAYGDGDKGTPGAVNTECPKCGDGLCNGEETCGDCDDCKCGDGFLCVDKTCVALKNDGELCGVGDECASGFCVDGVCCNAKCDGPCETCAKAGAEGKCTPYAANSDPESKCGLCQVCDGNGGCVAAAAGTDLKEDCTAGLATGCGLDGSCDGTGTCAYWDVTTECLPATCVGNVFNKADKCDGKGVCADAGTLACCPYNCDAAGKACRTSCTPDTDCCNDAYCSQSMCVPKKAAGQACTAKNQCVSNKCTAGKCE